MVTVGDIISNKDSKFARLHLLFGKASQKVNKLEKARVNFEYALSYFKKLMKKQKNFN